MSEPGLAITRVFDAPRERVWKEWTEPERFADWFGGPEADVPLSTVSMEVRTGSSWRPTICIWSRRWEGSRCFLIWSKALLASSSSLLARTCTRWFG